MKTVDILYFIEHAARELDIACAVKHLALSRYDISIEIRSIVLDLETTLTVFSPQIVVLPYCVSIKGQNLEKIVSQWPDARYINLSFEQLLGKAQKQIKAPRDDFAQDYVIHHAWGDFFQDFLLESGVPQSNVLVNGNPSYALYCDPYKRYYGDVRADLANKFDLDPEKRWVFVPENYGWAFFENHMLRDRIKRGFDAEHAFIYRDFSVDSLRTATQWWSAGAKLDDVELIVRPRPAVPRDIFVDKIRSLAGEIPDELHVIKYGSVREWILASDIVVSSYSTTLLEASIAQKQLYMLMPYPFPEFIQVDWNDLADKVKTESEFLTLIQQPYLDENWKPLEAWINKTMMSHGDPIANLAGFFSKILSGEIYVPQPAPLLSELSRPSFSKLIRPVRKFGWTAMQRGLSLIGVKTQAQVWNPHETDLITTDDVAERVGRWKEVLG
jgi:hypothetical protein